LKYKSISKSLNEFVEIPSAKCFAPSAPILLAYKLRPNV
jgi:hypothetical protein